MTALEVIKQRIQPPQHEAEARKCAPDVRMTLEAQQQRAEEYGQGVLHKLRQQQAHSAPDAVYPAEV